MAARVEAGKGVGAGMGEGVKRPMTIVAMSEKVRAINATQIGLICGKIVERVVNRLGPRGKLEATQTVALRKQTDGEELDKSEMLAQQFGNQFKDQQFLTARKLAELRVKGIDPVRSIITRSFSTPDTFAKEGYSFVLSNYEPEGFIKDAAGGCRILLDTTHIPRSYVVKLELDKESIEGEELVFVLQEFSCGKELTRKSFTIEDLEQECITFAAMTDSS